MSRAVLRATGVLTIAAAVRGRGEPEMNGEKGTASLAVILAGIQSAREGRRVEVAEVLAGSVLRPC